MNVGITTEFLSLKNVSFVITDAQYPIKSLKNVSLVITDAQYPIKKSAIC